MTLLKSFIVALSLAFSLGIMSTAAIAAGPPTAASTTKSINAVLAHTDEAIKAIDADAGPNEVRAHIKMALRECKEITGAEAMEKRRLKFSRLFKKARTEVKNGFAEQAREHLVEAKEKFESLKKYM